MDTSCLLTEISSRRRELFELLSDLIRIDSQSFSSHGNERECAEAIEKLCLELGLETERYSPLDVEGFTSHSDYMEGRGLEDRYNVTARYRGEDDTDELMLMAHIDTVGIGDEKSWTLPPLSGVVKDGRIYGRGACDDKYAIAAVLFIMKLLKEKGFVPKKNLVFSAYCDEEYGGSHGALASVLRYPSSRIVSLDGREGQIWHCASGGQEVRFNYHVKSAVDSAARAARAISVVMDHVNVFGNRRCEELEKNPFYKGTIIPKTALRYLEAKAGNNGMDMDKGTVQFVYYTDSTREEIWEELSLIENVLKEKLEQLGIVSDGFVPITRFFHYVYTLPDSEDIRLMCEASREATGRELNVCGSCLSDLSVISKFGSNRAFGFGAGRDFSEDGGAHQKDEFIECDALVDYTATVAAYIMKVLG